MFQYTLFVILAPFAATILIAVAVSAWNQHDNPNGRALAWYLFCAAGFLITNALELLTTSPLATLLFARLEYGFIISLPVAWVAFTLRFTGRLHWLSARRFWVFAPLPLATLALVWTNDLHHLVWQSYAYVPVSTSFGPLLAFKVVAYGPWFWVNGLYAYALLLMGGIMIGQEHYAGPRIYRKQTQWMLISLLPPLAFNLIYVFHLIPGWTKDYSPIAFALVGLAFAQNILRYSLLTLRPIARARLIDTMQDGMLVLDHKRKVVDMNPAAQRILKVSIDTCLGKPVNQVWQSRTWPSQAWPNTTPPNADALDSAALLGLPHPEMVALEYNSDTEENQQPVLRHYELHVTPLTGRRDSQTTGWLVILHDITSRKQAELALGQANQALGQANAELRHLNEELEARVKARTVDLQRRADELEALSRISSSIRKADTLDELLNVVILETIAVTDAGAGAVFLLEEEELSLAGQYNLPEELHSQPGLRHAACQVDGQPDPFWSAIQTGQTLHLPVRREDTRREDTRREDEEARRGCSLWAALTADWAGLTLMPLRAGHRMLGLLALLHQQPIVDAEDWPLTAVAEMAGNALQRVLMMSTLEQLVQDRTRDLSTLYEVTSTTNEFQDLSVVLQHILEKALDVLNGVVGLIHLMVEDEHAPGLRLAASLGLEHAPDPDPNLPRKLQRKEGPWQQVLDRARIVVVPEGSQQPDVSPCPPELERVLHALGAPAYVGVPVHAKGRTLGVLSVYGESLARFSAEDIALLAAIADHVGGAVENAQLRQKAEDGAVMEERQRLARDLHDSVTQTLYSMVLFAEAGRDALAPDEEEDDLPLDPDFSGQQVERARGFLERLRETSRQALKELRLLIYELRPLVLQKEGLVGALRDRLETVERRAGVRSMLKADDGIQLPPRVEAGLYGIAQEALNNVLKHAQANQVTVRVEMGFDQLELEIGDDGCGFVYQPNRSGGIGLASMHERTAALGGTLSIRSEMGRGTSVLVTLKRETYS